MNQFCIPTKKYKIKYPKSHETVNYYYFIFLLLNVMTLNLLTTGGALLIENLHMYVAVGRLEIFIYI